jgi:hypothetical protein
VRCSECHEPQEQLYAVVRNGETIASGLCFADAQCIRDSHLEYAPEVDCQIEASQ